MKFSDVLLETMYFRDIEKAPSKWRDDLHKLVDRHPTVQEYDPERQYSPMDTFVIFGKGNIPSEKNTVIVGNKYHDKKRQYAKLKGKVNTIETYTDALEVKGKEFIAKRNIGEKQKGQLINQLPDDPEAYIFQNLVKILAEFRVVTYYMNGEYHVSGIYKKSGSNVSVSQISTTSKLGVVLSKIAIKATKRLGYGLGGADIAIVGTKDLPSVVLGENVLGNITSKATRLVGRLDAQELFEGEYPVVLEVNSFPSMSNPAILFDLMKSIEKNRA